MPLVGFEPTISAGERPQTYDLDCAAAGTGANAHLTTGIFPCRLTILSSLTTAYYYQTTRCHIPEYGKN